MARVSLVALRKGLGGERETLTLIRRSTWGDWRRGPLNLSGRRHLREADLRLQLCRALWQRDMPNAILGWGFDPLGWPRPWGGSAGPKLWLGIWQRAAVRCAHFLGPGAAAPLPDDVDTNNGVGRNDRAATSALSCRGSSSTLTWGLTSISNLSSTMNSTLRFR